MHKDMKETGDDTAERALAYIVIGIIAVIGLFLVLLKIGLFR